MEVLTLCNQLIKIDTTLQQMSRHFFGNHGEEIEECFQRFGMGRNFFYWGSFDKVYNAIIHMQN